MLVDIANFKSPRNVVKESSNVSSSSYVMSVRRFLLVDFSFFFILIVHFHAHVTMMYRLVWAEMNMLEANSRLWC